MRKLALHGATQSCPDLQPPPAVGTMWGKHEGRCLQMIVCCSVMLSCRLRPQPSLGRGKPASCTLSKFQTHRTVSIGRSLYAVTFGGNWLFSDGIWNRWPRRAFQKPGQSTLWSLFPFVNATRPQEATGPLESCPLPSLAANDLGSGPWELPPMTQLNHKPLRPQAQGTRVSRSHQAELVCVLQAQGRHW